MQKKRRYIVFGVIISLIVCLTLLLVRCEGNPATDTPNRLLEVDEGAVQWEGDKNRPSNQTPGTIAIPGFDELTFIADQKQQYVNFHMIPLPRVADGILGSRGGCTVDLGSKSAS